MSALFDATIRVSLIVLVALAAMRLVRHRSAAMRHWILTAAIACAAVSPLLGPLVPSWRIGLVPAEDAPQAEVPAAQPTGRMDHGPAGDAIDVQTFVTLPDIVVAAPSGVPGAGFLLSLWIAGAVASLGVLLAGMARLRWLERRSARVFEGPWIEIAESVGRACGLRRTPLVLQSEHPALLVTWGFRRSRVIVPAGAQAWSRDRIRIVIAHELAHVRRRDWLVQLFAEMLRCVYWFNPLVWICSSRLRQESEQACDDAVLQAGIEGRTYAEHLLEIARAFRLHRHVWSPAPAIARSTSLERRVRAMLTDRTNREPVSPLVAGAVAAVLLSVTIPIAGFSAFAQTRFATVFGTATDESGLPLANATVALSNTQTSAKYEVRANQRGAFELVGLPAGDYELGIRRPGFESSSETLSVGVGETLERNIVLRIGTVQETITVTNGPRRTAEPGPAENRVVTGRPAARRPCPDPSVGGCIGPPLKVKDVRPIYPEALRDTSIAGTVLIEGQIGVDGRMKDMRVVSAPHPAFEQSALEAVGQWEFTATTLNDRAVDTRIRVNVSFAPEPPPTTQAQ